VSEYNPTFVDVSLEPAAEKPTVVVPSPSQGIWEKVQNQPWGWGLVRGSAMATLLGGLLLQSPGSALAAPSPDPSLPPARRTSDDGTVDRLVKRIGDDSPLWQFVEPGDGSALWRLAERIGPDSRLWERLERSGPDSALWKRVERLGSDSPTWNRLSQKGGGRTLNHLIGQLDSEGATWRRSGGPTFNEVDEMSGPVSSMDGTQAGAPARFIERCGTQNPLPLHSGSVFTATDAAPTFVDVDGDGDYDAFVGQTYGYGTCGYTYTDVRFFENTGDANSPAFTERCGANNPLPLYDGYGGYSFRPVPTFVDIDGDGDFDAFVGQKYGYGACGYTSYDVRFFENTGDADSPAFTERCGTNNPLYNGSGYYSSHAAPTFVDIDGDGDFDAFVGQKYGYGACGYTSYDVRFFENTGDANNPDFAERCGATNPLGAYAGHFGGGYSYYEGYYYYGGGPAPTFVDLDGDGDFDAFVGEGYGGSGPCGPSGLGIRFFENAGGANAPDFTERCGDANPLYSGYTYVGPYSYEFLGLGAFARPMPTFVEIDGDGDFDAFVGELGGYGACGYTDRDVRFFENDPLRPVGGTTQPAEPTALFQPWASLAGLGLAGAITMALRKLKQYIF
jgi:hypothetical protein